MQKKFFLLLSTISLISTAHAADRSEQSLTEAQLTVLISIMKKENRAISPDDSYAKRTLRNLHRCWTAPYKYFGLAYSETCKGAQAKDYKTELEDTLVDYVIDQKLTVNEKNIFSQPAPVALEMRDGFEQDQRNEIRKYISRQIPRSPEPEVWITMGCCATGAVACAGLACSSTMPMSLPTALALMCGTCSAGGFSYASLQQ